MIVAFGKAFKTLKEAKDFLKKQESTMMHSGMEVRKMSKKLFPRRKKLFHVGTETDFLNFA